MSNCVVNEDVCVFGVVVCIVRVFLMDVFFGGDRYVVVFLCFVCVSLVFGELVVNYVLNDVVVDFFDFENSIINGGFISGFVFKCFDGEFYYLVFFLVLIFLVGVLVGVVLVLLVSLKEFFVGVLV